MRASWQETLLGQGSPDWFNLEHDRRALCVKAGHARKTWRVTLRQSIVFAKVWDVGHLLDRLKRWTVGSAAQREWRVSREAEARGVPVVRGLAVGVSLAHPRWAVFVSEGLADAASLPDAWERDVGRVPRSNRPAAAAGLIDAVARLFAVAHERGFVHGDAHPNNVVVRTASTGQPEALFVDVHSARLTRRPASVRRTFDSLAQLDQHFHRCATRVERLRFLHDYLIRRPSMAGYGDERSVDRTLLTALARASALRAARLARHRDRRLRRNGKYFTTLSLKGGWKATVALRLERRHVFPEPDVPDRSESDWRVIVKPLVVSMGNACGCGDVLDHAELQVEITRPGRFSRRLLATLLGSPHRRMFERCHRLRHRDVAGELILAYVEHWSRGLVDVTMLIRPKRGPEAGSSGKSYR